MQQLMDSSMAEVVPVELFNAVYGMFGYAVDDKVG
jgi:hypothetical protein